MSASAGRIMMIPKGDYDATVTYRILDIVSYNGSSYVAKRTTVGNVPTDTNYWQPVADMSAKMDRSVYDSNNNGIVDNAEKVNNHTVEKDVPEDAKFTDTKTLSGMTDTDINNPTDGQTLRYNSTTQKFENGTVASSFNSLSDTNFVDLRDGQVPMYNSETSKWINVDVEGIVPIVTWANGTDAQIIKMLEAHYQGLIDIHDYWTEGDERVIHISQIEGSNATNNYVIPAQDITMVLMDARGKQLTTAINNISTGAFIVGQKRLLQNADLDNFSPAYIRINDTDTNVGGWESCLARTWYNSAFRNALPSDIRSIFKQHINKTSAGSPDHDTVVNSNDYFFMPSEKEMYGAVTYANSTAEADNTQIKYFETVANQRQTVNGSFYWDYWVRSPQTGGSSGTRFCYSKDNTGIIHDVSDASAMHPFIICGVI